MSTFFGSFSSLLRVSATLCVALVPTVRLVAGPAATGQAVVRKVDGGVRYQVTGEWRAPEPGTVLMAGTEVRTGPASRLELDLGDNGGTVKLEPDTTVVIDRLRLPPEVQSRSFDTNLKLQAGAIEGRVDVGNATSKFEVALARGAIGVRGARCRFTLTADYALTVHSGLVVMVYVVEDQERPLVYIVNGGERFNPETRRVEPSKP